MHKPTQQPDQELASGEVLPVKAICLLALLGAGGIFLVSQYQETESTPATIYRAPYYATDSRFAVAPGEQYADSVLALTVLSESRSKLSLQLDYTYSGKHGEQVIVCGDVLQDNRTTYDFGCMPAAISIGQSSTMVQFSFSPEATSWACSNGIAISFYAPGESPFFEQAIPFEKRWSDGSHWLPGFMLDLVC